MVKKLFALASVTALTGLVASAAAAGCSSTEVINGGDASADARREASRPADTDEPAAESCKAQGKFEAEAIKPNAPQQKACTSEQIEALSAKCAEGADADPNNADCKAARDATENKGCADCIFGSDADAQWKVVNLNPDAERKVRYNQAGCIELASGVKDCGGALLTLNICLNAYCSDCGTESEQGTCVNEVIEGECSEFRITSACAKAALQTYEKQVEDCFAKREDVDDSRLFVYMSTLACGSGSSIKDAGEDG